MSNPVSARPGRDGHSSRWRSLEPYRLTWWVICVLLFAKSALAGALLSVGSGTGAAGSVVNIPVSVGGDAAVAAQFDLIYSSAALSTDGALVSDPTLVVSSRPLSAQARRVLVYSRLSQPLPQGAIVSVPVRIAANASLATTTMLATNVILADGQFRRVSPVTASPGTLTITAGGSLRFKSVLFGPDAALHLELSAAGAGHYTIQSSPDLRLWTSISTNQPVNGVIEAGDTNSARLPHQFYRAFLLP